MRLNELLKNDKLEYIQNESVMTLDEINDEIKSSKSALSEYTRQQNGPMMFKMKNRIKQLEEKKKAKSE